MKKREIKDKPLLIRMSGDERATLSEAAWRRRMSVAAYMRGAALRRAKVDLRKAVP